MNKTGKPGFFEARRLRTIQSLAEGLKATAERDLYGPKELTVRDEAENVRRISLLDKTAGYVMGDEVVVEFGEYMPHVRATHYESGYDAYTDTLVTYDTRGQRNSLGLGLVIGALKQAAKLQDSENIQSVAI
jgi:hypothetical protein